jgi:hypothetical protein
MLGRDPESEKMSVPLYFHIPVVLALLASNAVTFTICKRRVEELKAALLAKRVLLGDGDEVDKRIQAVLARSAPQTCTLIKGETLTIEGDRWRAQIQSSNPSTISVDNGDYMTPKPWSHSALEQFKNCPRAYHAHRVDKSVPYVEGPEAAYGNMVHKAFEDRVRDGKPLPADLQLHETYLARLASLPGQIYVEREIAVNRKLQPCGYWDEDVWYRAKIDYLNINDGRARIVDYKTGKPHQKLLQLFEYILFTMIVFPEVETAYAEYYWTKAPECPTGTGGAWPRERDERDLGDADAGPEADGRGLPHRRLAAAAVRAVQAPLRRHRL